VKQFTPPIPSLVSLHPVRVIAAAFNLLTLQQPWAAERLIRHAGKTVRMTLGGFAVTMTIDSEGHLAQSDAAVVPDVTLDVIAEKLTLSRLFASPSQADMAELINISGQAALAQVVSDLARDLRLDPEDALANVIGDVAAHKLLGSARDLAKTFRTSAQSLTQNMAEYLSEETDSLTGRPALAMHGQRYTPLDSRIDALSVRQANLIARLDRLAGKRPTS